jgi:type IV pilus assembly protein PilV
MKHKAGFTLLNALIALLVFTFGMLSLASAYLKVNTNLGDNEYFTSAGILAESLKSTLSASPNLLTQMNAFAPATTTPTGALVDWIAQLTAALPQGTATATAVNATGVACTATPPCTVTLIISWQKKILHSQSFVLQVGY